MKSVSVVIPNWNGRQLLEKNLPSVIRASQKDKQIAEIIVVDDASGDSSVEYLRATHPEARLFRHKKNRGFAAAVNLGVRMARGELVCLLNTDVSASVGFLVHATRHFKRREVFGVSLHEKGYGFTRGVFESGFITHTPETSKETKETFWVSGGSGVFRRTMWNSLKGFDAELFAPYYWEDVDLCYRAQKRGLVCLWEPKGLVYHEHESTTGKVGEAARSRVQERNQLLFIWKNLTSSNLRRRHYIGLLKRGLRHPGYLRIVFMALKKYRAVRRLHALEAKEATVSDESIFAKFS